MNLSRIVPVSATLGDIYLPRQLEECSEIRLLETTSCTALQAGASYRRPWSRRCAGRIGILKSRGEQHPICEYDASTISHRTIAPRLKPR